MTYKKGDAVTRAIYVGNFLLSAARASLFDIDTLIISLLTILSRRVRGSFVVEMANLFLVKEDGCLSVFLLVLNFVILQLLIGFLEDWIRYLLPNKGQLMLGSKIPRISSDAACYFI